MPFLNKILSVILLSSEANFMTVLIVKYEFGSEKVQENTGRVSLTFD